MVLDFLDAQRADGVAVHGTTPSESPAPISESRDDQLNAQAHASVDRKVNGGWAREGCCSLDPGDGGFLVTRPSHLDLNHGDMVIL